MKKKNPRQRPNQKVKRKNKNTCRKQRYILTNNGLTPFPKMVY